MGSYTGQDYQIIVSEHNHFNSKKMLSKIGLLFSTNISFYMN